MFSMAMSVLGDHGDVADKRERERLEALRKMQRSNMKVLGVVLLGLGLEDEGEVGVPAAAAAAAAAATAATAAVSTQKCEPFFLKLDPIRPSLALQGKAAWLQAARCGAFERLQELLARQPSLIGAQEDTGTGNTALHWCAATGDLEAIGWLISRGAACGARNFGGSTALHSAAGQGRLECVRLLLRQAGGAELVRQMDDSDRTAEQLAHRRGHAAVAELLQSAAEGTPPKKVLHPNPNPTGGPRRGAAKDAASEYRAHKLRSAHAVQLVEEGEARTLHPPP